VDRRGRIEALYALHIQETTRLAFLLTGELETAEDLAQDAFIKAAGLFQDLRAQEAFSAYLMKTLVNGCRAHWRRRHVERKYLRRSVGHPGTNDRTGELEDRLAIIDAVEGLSRRQQTAVVLRHYADLSESRTAELMGCSVGTVKTLTSRGLTALRERVSHERF
jgi:RNA polymerase sigma-70 factor (sigma-E family)